MSQTPVARNERVEVSAGRATLDGDLEVPPTPTGVVVVAGREEAAPLAQALTRNGLATLRVDPLTPAERAESEGGYAVGLMAERIRWAAWYAARQPELKGLKPSLVASDVEAAAAFVAAVQLGDEVEAVASVSGRADLAGEYYLEQCTVPALLLAADGTPGLVELAERAADVLPEGTVRSLPADRGLTEEPASLAWAAGELASWLGGGATTQAA